LPPTVGKWGIKRCFCQSVCLSVRPSVAYIANNSRTQRPSVLKFRTKVPHLRCDSHTSFKVKRSKVRVRGGRGHTVSAEPGGHTACLIIAIYKYSYLLTYLVLKCELIEQLADADESGCTTLSRRPRQHTKSPVSGRRPVAGSDGQQDGERGHRRALQPTLRRVADIRQTACTSTRCCVRRCRSVCLSHTCIARRWHI